MSGSPAAARTRLFGISIVAAAVLACLSAPAQAWQPPDAAHKLCAKAIRAEEKRSRIPAGIMTAIAAVESGRWDETRRANIAWPWTVTAGGKGKFYPSRQAAIRAVEALRQRGVHNIDVGCMQINLGYHPDAFTSLQQAFDPAANVAYAADFLKRLYARERSWPKAVRFYHSSDPERQRYYGNKVFKARQQLRALEARQRRDQVATRADAQTNAVRAEKTRTPARSYLGNTYANWPPRNYRAQQQLEQRARSWAFSRSR